MRNVVRSLAAALAMSLIAQAVPASADDCAMKVNLKEAAKRTGALTQMAAATEAAGLSNPEVKVGPLTLLAPTDEAFNALPEEFRTRLLAPENRAHLVTLLLHHAIPGEFPTERLLKAKVKHYAIDAIDGSQVEITTRRGIDVAGAKIVKADIIATDGIIHLIDKVLIPPSVMAALSQPQQSAALDAEAGEVPLPADTAENTER